MQTLVVIDMQSAYSAYKRALNGVRLEIEQAIFERRPIVLVEFHSYAIKYPNKTTVKSIRNLLKDYDYAYYTPKYEVDGSSQIHKCHLKHRRYNFTGFDLCGVNTCHCVGDTAKGLIKLGYNVSVLRNACACTCIKECKIQPYHQFAEAA